MAQITTTSSTTPFAYQYTLIERSLVNGYLYVMVKSSTADRYDLYRSTNGGTSWSLFLSLTRTNVVEIGPIFLLDPRYNILLWCYRTNESSTDRVYVRAIPDLGAATPTWTSEVLVTAWANGGAPGAAITGMALASYVVTGSFVYVVTAIGLVTGGNQLVRVYGLRGSTVLDLAVTGIVNGTVSWGKPGSGRSTPSLEIQHNGDGKTSSTPNLWLSFGRAYLGVVKLAWNGSGWTAPSSMVTVRTDLAGADSISGRWDGVRFVLAVPNPVAGATDTVLIHERDQSNTTTTTRTTPAHPTGTIRNATVSYNAVSRDIRVYAVGTSTTVLYFVDFIRSTGLWGTWGQVSANALLGAAGDNYAVRRGSYGNAKHDVIDARTGTPNITEHFAQSLSYTPYPPTWNLAGQTYTNGGAADVAAALPLAWTFADPDPADTQSAYALSRQVGAGTLAYYRASDATWQATEQKNTSGTNGVTLAAAWAAGSDAQYTFKVKTWDSSDVASLYSDGLVIIPSAKVNPTITAPAAAGTITSDHVTLTWTVSEQSQYRVQLNVTGAELVYDSGWVADTAARSLVIPYTLPDATNWTITLSTRNTEGLASNDVTRQFTVDYLEPPQPSVTAVANPANGVINVTLSSPTPVGAQPTVINREIWRRAWSAPALNANPYFETNASDWTAVNSTIVRSTTYAHQGVASLRLTPNGTGAACYAQCGTVLLDQNAYYTAEAWGRPDTANKPLRVYLHFWSGVTFLSSLQLDMTVVAGGWFHLELTGPGNSVPAADRISMAAGIVQTPAVTDVVYLDEMILSVGTTDAGIRMARDLGSTLATADWRAASGVAYQYRARVTGDNGTSVYSAWVS